MSGDEQKKEVLAIRDAMIDKHVKMIKDAAKKGVKILCMQEIFAGPYFCAERHPRWYYLAEPIPGHTTEIMQGLAKKHGMIIIVPIYETVMTGVYYNSAAVIDNDGKILGIYRKNHIPEVPPGFSEKYYFKPGNLGYPVFRTEYGTIGVYICYDRHFPEGARLLGLHGADIIFNPSATVEGVSKYLWEIEQPAHAVANGYFVGAINRVGTEAPWNMGRFYGNSYFCSPRGKIIAQASPDKDELLVSDLDFDEVREVRNTWQFFRDRRPETYEDMVKLLP
ncbi:MAG: nitrilase-related carbon-nitrogen hydrolase [Candidatus Eremiobacteraeota bacterium]|nr:nitrilase-related carbon-nitrogen hydrolase [Candidatus Eremiobacteraeota bacterium]